MTFQEFTDDELKALLSLKDRRAESEVVMRAVIDGPQIRWRALSAAELLDELIASCRGEVE